MLRADRREYRTLRRQLLGAASWNRYVSSRGLNADAGRAKLRETQATMAALRAAWKVAA